jgi:hypothetical protein
MGAVPPMARALGWSIEEGQNAHAHLACRVEIVDVGDAWGSMFGEHGNPAQRDAALAQFVYVR